MGAFIATIDFVIVVAYRKQLAAPLNLAEPLPQPPNSIKLSGHDENIEQGLANNSRHRCALSGFDSERERR
jgi:hypothetical protein